MSYRHDPKGPVSSPFLTRSLSREHEELQKNVNQRNPNSSYNSIRAHRNPFEVIRSTRKTQEDDISTNSSVTSGCPGSKVLPMEHRIAIFDMLSVQVLTDLVLDYCEVPSFQGKKQGILEGHTREITAIITCPHYRLISGSADNDIRVWDLISNTCLHTLTGHSDRITVLKMVTMSIVASGSADHTIRIWDINTGVCLKVSSSHLLSDPIP